MRASQDLGTDRKVASPPPAAAASHHVSPPAQAVVLAPTTQQAAPAIGTRTVTGNTLLTGSSTFALHSEPALARAHSSGKLPSSSAPPVSPAPLPAHPSATRRAGGRGGSQSLPALPPGRSFTLDGAALALAVLDADAARVAQLTAAGISIFTPVARSEINRARALEPQVQPLPQAPQSSLMVTPIGLALERQLPSLAKAMLAGCRDADRSLARPWLADMVDDAVARQNWQRLACILDAAADCVRSNMLHKHFAALLLHGRVDLAARLIGHGAQRLERAQLLQMQALSIRHGDADLVRQALALRALSSDECNMLLTAALARGDWSILAVLMTAGVTKVANARLVERALLRCMAHGDQQLAYAIYRSRRWGSQSRARFLACAARWGLDRLVLLMRPDFDVRRTVQRYALHRAWYVAICAGQTVCARCLADFSQASAALPVSLHEGIVARLARRDNMAGLVALAGSGGATVKDIFACLLARGLQRQVDELQQILGLDFFGVQAGAPLEVEANGQPGGDAMAAPGAASGAVSGNASACEHGMPDAHPADQADEYHAGSADEYHVARTSEVPAADAIGLANTSALASCSSPAHNVAALWALLAESGDGATNSQALLLSLGLGRKAAADVAALHRSLSRACQRAAAAQVHLSPAQRQLAFFALLGGIGTVPELEWQVAESDNLFYWQDPVLRAEQARADLERGLLRRGAQQAFQEVLSPLHLALAHADPQSLPGAPTLSGMSLFQVLTGVLGLPDVLAGLLQQARRDSLQRPANTGLPLRRPLRQLLAAGALPARGRGLSSSAPPARKRSPGAAPRRNVADTALSLLRGLPELAPLLPPALRPWHEDTLAALVESCRLLATGTGHGSRRVE